MYGNGCELVIIKAKECFSERRVRCGLSLSELASKSGLSKESVLRIEHGRAVRPGNTKKICAALHTEFDELFDVLEG